MSGGGIYSPWNEQPLTERAARVKDECRSPRAAREADLDAPSIADDGGVSNCVGGAEVARRSHKPEVEGSNPSPATNSLRVGGLTVEPEGLGHVVISEAALLALNLIATAKNESLGAAVARCAAFYVNSELGGHRGAADLREGDGA